MAARLKCLCLGAELVVFTALPYLPRLIRALHRGLAVMRAMPPVRLSAWADENFYLSAESSYTEGRWKSYPPQIGILDAMGNDDIQEVNLRKSARVGYNKMLGAATTYFTAVKRRNQAIWEPTDSDAQEFVESEYNSALRDVKAIKPVFPALEKKHAHNTNSYKKFLGCVTYVKGGSSARNFRRISVDVAILDEIDGFDKDIDQEGSPRKLAKKRLEGAVFPKMIVGSTPKLKYLSEITAAIQEADAVFKYHIPCPQCDALQFLYFGGEDKPYGLKWINRDPNTAAYCCIACQSLFTQADYIGVWKKGRWQSENGDYYDHDDGKWKDCNGAVIRPPRHVGFDNYWAIYSPQTAWSTIVKEWLGAVAKARHGEKSDLKTFINTTLGQDYEDDVEKTESSELKKRAEDYPLQTVPMGGLIVKIGIDVQKWGFHLLAWALGRGEESWVIDRQLIAANPEVQAEWNKLDAFLLHKYPHAAGTVLGADSAAIDTGGYWTHQAYNYVRDRRWALGWSVNAHNPPKLFAVKGSSISHKPISGRAQLQDVNNYDKVIKSGVKLYEVGTDTAKDLFHGRIGVPVHGPGYVHLSKYLPDDFFEQITNEVRVIKHTPKGAVSSWVKRRTGVKNEDLDCTVYCLFCAHKSALHRKTQTEWTVLERIVQPNQDDLFSIAASLSPPQHENSPIPANYPPPPAGGGRARVFIPG